MSSRALRRLQGESLNLQQECGIQEKVTALDGDGKSLGILSDQSNNTGDGTEADLQNTSSDEMKQDNVSLPSVTRDVRKKEKGNPFGVLALEDSDHEDSGSPKEEEVIVASPKVEKSRRKKKKNKKKANSALTDTSALGADLDEEDEIASSIRQVNAILGECPTVQIDNNAAKQKHAIADFLSMDKRNFNPDLELRRMFGSRMMQNELPQRNPRGRRRHGVHQRTTYLAQYKDSWPQMSKSGLTMNLESREADSAVFIVEHKREYQQGQIAFWRAADSMDPQQIVDILKVYPYHIDTLLQLSDICKMNEDMVMAADMIDRALYAYECNFHPLFKITSGTCRLRYRHTENRSFFIALFRKLVFLGNRTCYYTALEFAKLLFSLDPVGDPLCVLLLIDYYALRAKQYDYLVALYHHLEAEKSLGSLPNFAFSVPLAMFYIAIQEGTPTTTADTMLQDALLQFPSLLLPLLDKCNIKPDSRAEKHALFSPAQEPSVPLPLQQLIELYVCRNHSCWIEPDVMQWLEHNVTCVMDRVDKGEPLVEKYRKRNINIFRKSPRNIVRHLVICDVPGVTVQLPVEYSSQAVLSYDPLPPVDSVAAYARPQRMTRAQQGEGFLSSFIQSLLPRYNADEIAQGAEGPEANAQQRDVRHQAAELMEVMRNLLQNIAQIPQGEDNQEQPDEPQLDEWD